MNISRLINHSPVASPRQGNRTAFHDSLESPGSFGSPGLPGSPRPPRSPRSPVEDRLLGPAYPATTYGRGPGMSNVESKIGQNLEQLITAHKTGTSSSSMPHYAPNEEILINGFFSSGKGKSNAEAMNFNAQFSRPATYAGSSVGGQQIPLVQQTPAQSDSTLLYKHQLLYKHHRSVFGASPDYMPKPYRRPESRFFPKPSIEDDQLTEDDHPSGDDSAISTLPPDGQADQQQTHLLVQQTPVQLAPAPEHPFVVAQFIEEPLVPWYMQHRDFFLLNPGYLPKPYHRPVSRFFPGVRYFKGPSGVYVPEEPIEGDQHPDEDQSSEDDQLTEEEQLTDEYQPSEDDNDHASPLPPPLSAMSERMLAACASLGYFVEMLAMREGYDSDDDYTVGVPDGGPFTPPPPHPSMVERQLLLYGLDISEAEMSRYNAAYSARASSYPSSSAADAFPHVEPVFYDWDAAYDADADDDDEDEEDEADDQRDNSEDGEDDEDDEDDEDADSDDGSDGDSDSDDGNAHFPQPGVVSMHGASEPNEWEWVEDEEWDDDEEEEEEDELGDDEDEVERGEDGEDEEEEDEEQDEGEEEQEEQQCDEDVDLHIHFHHHHHHHHYYHYIHRHHYYHHYGGNEVFVAVPICDCQCDPEAPCNCHCHEIHFCPCACHDTRNGYSGDAGFEYECADDCWCPCHGPIDDDDDNNNNNNNNSNEDGGDSGDDSGEDGGDVDDGDDACSYCGDDSGACFYAANSERRAANFVP